MCIYASDNRVRPRVNGNMLDLVHDAPKCSAPWEPPCFACVRAPLVGGRYIAVMLVAIAYDTESTWICHAPNGRTK